MKYTGYTAGARRGRRRRAAGDAEDAGGLAGVRAGALGGRAGQQARALDGRHDPGGHEQHPVRRVRRVPQPRAARHAAPRAQGTDTFPCVRAFLHET